MIDPNDRIKFEWLDAHSERDRHIRTGIRVVLVVAFAVFIALVILLLRTPQQNKEALQQNKEALFWRFARFR